MKLGIGSYTFTWAIGVPGRLIEDDSPAMDVFGLLDRAIKLGVDVVQVADNLPLHALTEIQLRAFGRRADEAGVAIEVGTRGVGRDHLLRYLELAVRLRSPILRIVVDTDTHRPSVDDAVRAISDVTPEFEHADVRIAIENHDRFRVTELVQVVNRVGSEHVGICLDTVNSLGALEGPEVVVEGLAPLAIGLHVKDFEIRRASHMMGFHVEGTPAGRGRLDVSDVLSRISAAGRNPNAILELWTPPEPTLRATVAKEDAWAVESIEYLRRLIPNSAQ